MADFIELNIEDVRWQALGIKALAVRAFGETLRHFDLDPENFEISLLACDDARIKGLNSDFRDKAQPTNVLSWPAQDRANPGAHPKPPDLTLPELGDIAIAYEICQREADAAGIDVADHVSHLLVHGLLHLLGYDHISDKDACLMQSAEVKILGNLGISDPYRVK